MSHPSGRTRGRRRVAWVLLLAFVVLPLIEVYVLVQVGQVVGALWTIVLLVASGVVGSWLMRREGSRAWRALSEALESGRMPGRELADGGLILVGGTLMLTPGFVTDAFGVLMVLPVTRPLFRGLLAQVVTRRLVVAGPMAGAGPRDARRPGHPSDDGVVRGEVIDEG